MVEPPFFALGELPDDLLAAILARMPSTQISIVTSRVCRAWTIGDSRHVWLCIAAKQNVSMPRGATGVSLRSSVNLRRTYFLSVARRAAYRRAEAEGVLLRLWGRIKLGELRAAALDKVFRGENAVDPNHRLGLHRGWTAAFMAAWAGRVKTLERLVRLHGADLSIRDNNDCSPIGVAAWAGNAAVVAWILKSGCDFGSLVVAVPPPAHAPVCPSLWESPALNPQTPPCLQVTFVPPMTSSCGGKGPFSPVEWARRKGHAKVVTLLEAHAARAAGAGAASARGSGEQQACCPGSPARLGLAGGPTSEWSGPDEARPART
jgi:hypothetical protein